MVASRPPFNAALIALLPTLLAAQQPDSAQRLPDLEASGTRAARIAASSGVAVTVLDRAALARGRPLPSLEEALAHVPGLVARDRGDQSLDARLTIRGAGARANFGVRGIRVLLDGVPATLPDGQTPLTALDLLLAERIEVARGPLAALHGNGSLGVVAIETAARLDGPWQARGGIEAGSDATATWHGVAGGGGERLGGVVAVARSRSDGWREHAASEQWRGRAALQWQPSPRSALTLRATAADDPILESPGAVTLAEFAVDPRQASPNSVRRDAGKRLTQQSLSLGWRAAFDAINIEASTWITGRDLDNPIAAPAPAPADPDEGIWIGIDRRVTGLRTAIRSAPGTGIVLLAGVDAQRMVDDRINRRHRAGEPTGPALLDQQERITEVGAFGHVAARVAPALSVRLGLRHDRVGFTVDDHLAPAAGGSRTMAAWSTSGALAWTRGSTEAWVGLGSAFETPTTTELANRPDGGTGLNVELDPARTLSIEAGMRWSGAAFDAEMVAWHATTRDAIVPVAEAGGRSFYDNVGQTRSPGVEAAMRWQPTPAIQLRLSATWIDARFGDQAVAADGSAVSGHRLPGVAPFTARLGATVAARGLVVDLDHGLNAATWADDRNSLQAPGWGVGVTNLHLRWRPTTSVAVVAGARNLFDRRHVASVVVNGGFGRVIEPGRPRTVSLGAQLAIGS